MHVTAALKWSEIEPNCESQARFAYAYHRRNGLRVYLYGKEADGPHLTQLAEGSAIKVAQRPTMTSDWARLSPYYLELDTEREARASVPLLLYAASQIKPTPRHGSYLLPSEDFDSDMLEGARVTVQVSRIERDPGARRKCIQLFGASCAVCGFDFARTYGDIGLGFIHVHHLNPLSSSKGRRKVNPSADLRPVCPNCHEMLHRQKPPFTIDQMKTMVAGAEN